jgi:hypothetical protein
MFPPGFTGKIIPNGGDKKIDTKGCSEVEQAGTLVSKERNKGK